MESDVPAGEYQIAVQYSDIWLYSDVFTVSYAGTPQATVKNTTVSGTRGEALMNPVEVVITLKFDTFQSVAVDDNVKSWFTNLPAGLTAVINYVSSDQKSVYITINGTPTQVKDEAMAITIPAGKLTSRAALTVTSNPEAKFVIAESPYALTKLNLSAELNLEALMSYGSITAAPEEAHSDKYDIIVLGVTREDTELGTENVADPGEKLKLTVGVIAKDPYLLEDADLDSLNIQVGGHTAKPKTIYYEDGYAHESVKGENGLWYWVFVVPEAFTVPAYTFSNITFTIPEASAGALCGTTVTVQNGSEAPGSKLNTSAEWTDLGTDGTGNTAMTESSKFQAGHYYECRVKFTTSDKTNYQFPEAGNMTITANGKTIQETMSPYESPLVSCFAREYEESAVKYTVYLRYGLGTGMNVAAVGDIPYTVSGNVVTTTSTSACKLGYLGTGGNYVAIAATENADGSHSYTVPDGVTEVLLVVKGDTNGDGSLSNADYARLNAVLLEKTTMTW